MQKLKHVLLSVVLIFGASSLAGATTITFNSQPSQSSYLIQDQLSVVDSGFRFVMEALYGDVIDSGFYNVNLSYNGTPYLRATHYDNVRGAMWNAAEILMERVDGQPFSVQSFDAAIPGFRDANVTPHSLTVYGLVSGSDPLDPTFVQSGFTMTTQFQTFFLPNTFVNLDKVWFVSDASNPDPHTVPGLSLDNVVTAPEPASLALLLTGVLGLAGWSRGLAQRKGNQVGRSGVGSSSRIAFDIFNL